MATLSNIKYEICHSPAYGSLVLTLPADQTLLVESGAMAAMDPWLALKSKVKGGLRRGVGRLLGGESFFISEVTAQGKSGKLYLSPGVPGDIHHYSLQSGQGLMIQSSGFVAATPGVELDTQFQGFKGFFSGESLFLLRARGEGDIWFSSYGAVLPVSVTGDYVVDTGYIVAFEDSLDYAVEVLGGLSFRGLKTGILGGEGFVCRFRGEGRVWIQSREVYQLLNYLYPFRPVKSNN
ncbi:MAG: TIGR00266 family protein [Cyanothece sp. SIO1E1]|nr:TIGR00266 family protein [Cyanothece sp. SIO1E1]